MSNYYNDVRDALTVRGYVYHGDGVFTQSLCRSWTSWLGINKSGGGSFRTSLGLINSQFIAVISEAKKVFQSNVPDQSSLEMLAPIFLVELTDVLRRVPLAESLITQVCFESDVAIDCIITHAQPFLQRSSTYQACLDNLDLFSKTLQMYPISRSVLLRLLGNDQEYISFTTTWLKSLEKYPQIEVAYRRYVAELQRLEAVPIS